MLIEDGLQDSLEQAVGLAWVIGMIIEAYGYDHPGADVGASPAATAAHEPAADAEVYQLHGSERPSQWRWCL